MSSSTMIESKNYFFLFFSFFKTLIKIDPKLIELETIRLILNSEKMRVFISELEFDFKVNQKENLDIHFQIMNMCLIFMRHHCPEWSKQHLEYLEEFVSQSMTQGIKKQLKFFRLNRYNGPVFFSEKMPIVLEMMGVWIQENTIGRIDK